MLKKITFLLGVCSLLFIKMATAQDMAAAWKLFNDNKRAEAREAFAALSKSGDSKAEAELSLALMDKDDDKDESAFKHFVNFFNASENPYPYLYSLWSSSCVFNGYNKLPAEKLAFLKKILTDPKANGTIKAMAHGQMGYHFARIGDFEKSNEEYAKIGGVFSAFCNSCSITTPVSPLTKVQASQCGVTLASIATQVVADPVPAAVGYRFRITNGTNVQIVDNVYRVFLFTQLTTYAFNTTYSVEVAYKIGTTYSGFGASCNVTTPATIGTSKVQPSQCGSTLPTIATQVVADAVTGATGYRFKITNGANVQIVDNTYRIFKFTQLTTYAYNTTYGVEVAAKMNSGAYGAYGVSCNITTPAIIGTTQVQASQCGVTLASINTKVFADPLPGAIGYRFRVTNGANVQIFDNTYRVLKFTQLATYALNTTYIVEVAGKMIGGSYGAFGSPCNVTTPSIAVRLNGGTLPNAKSLIDSASPATTEAVTIYPNPTNGNFSFDINTNEINLTKIELVNVLGQKIYSETVTDNNYNRQINISPAKNGVYLLMITDADGKRMTKQIVIAN